MHNFKTTKKSYVFRSFRLRAADLYLWEVAAARLEISRSDFLRRALVEKALRVLGPSQGTQDQESKKTNG